MSIIVVKSWIEYDGKQLCNACGMLLGSKDECDKSTVWETSECWVGWGTLLESLDERGESQLEE